MRGMTDAPLDPNVPIDYEAAQLAAAQREKEARDATMAHNARIAESGGRVTVAGRKTTKAFPVLDELSAVTFGKLQDAEERGNITQLIETIPLVFAKEARDEVLALLTDEDEVITIETLGKIYRDAVEITSARPTTSQRT